MNDKTWDGRPECQGWHWLQHKKSGQFRMAFWSRPHSWRVSDAIGRTVLRTEYKTARIFDYHSFVNTPGNIELLPLRQRAKEKTDEAR